MTLPDQSRQLRPAPAVRARTAYGIPRAKVPIDLYLDGNEGLPAPIDVTDLLGTGCIELVRRYPNARSLEALLSERHGISPERVIVTAGGDDALDRACRTMLYPGREMVVPQPTFEMFPRYAELAGATTVSVVWREGPFPVDAVLSRVNERTGVIVVVTPNNPTGLTATAAEIQRVAESAPHALVLCDLAYIEFADRDVTQAVLGIPNAVAVRTFSKAYGLAGLRVGYAMGSEEIIGWLRTAGGPYPVSSVSLAIAIDRLASSGDAMTGYVSRVRDEREELSTLLEQLGASTWSSQGNFVLARFGDATAVHLGLATLGIAVRAYPLRPGLEDCLRVTCPGHAAQFARVCSAFRSLGATVVANS